jgi:FAD/FMN-containing dehydrogenase
VDAAWAPVAARSIGSYGNFTEVTGDAVITAMYPTATLARLRAAKTVYDPQNRFRDNHNITPG